MGPKKQGKKRGSEAAEPPAAAAAATAAAADEKPSKKKAAAAAEEQPASEEENEDVSEDLSDDEGEGENSEEDGEPSAVMVWQEQLKQRAEAMNAIVCMVGGMDKDGSEAGEDEDDEDDEEEEITLEKVEKCTRLFLPKKTEEFLEPLSEALAEIGCTPPDSEDMEGEDEYAQHKERMAQMPEEIKALFRWQVRGLSTRHSLPMQELLKASLKDVDKSLKAKKYDDAFCRWAATLMAANDEEHWYGDTEDAQAAEGIFKQLKKQWGQLKKLGLKDLGGPSAEGPCTDPKKALDHMLETLADSMRGMEYDV